MTLARIVGWTAMLLAAIWLTGQILRDRFWFTGLCFYVPTPLILLGLLLAAAILYGLQHRRSARHLLLAASVPLLAILLAEHRWIVTPPTTSDSSSGASSSPADTFCVVHWNVWHARYGTAPVADTLKTHPADLYTISEILPGEQWRSLRTEFGSEFSGLHLGKDLAVLGRGELSATPLRSLGFGVGSVITWRRPFRPEITLLMVDCPSSWRIHRDPTLAAIHDEIQRIRPDLVIGDFNAPRQSLRLLALPAGYRHAYDAAGAGWSATWPVPLPLWSIDQCIAGPALVTRQYSLHSSRLSDHRLQRAEFSRTTIVRPTPPAASPPRPQSSSSEPGPVSRLHQP